jgi:indole-3-glycerol phosphate synthase
MSDTLARILADKRNFVGARKQVRSFADLERDARAASCPRGFCEALSRAQRDGRFGLIAEIKKASPSKGLIRADFEPAELARAYEAGGATCLSVLTDEPYFQGADRYLRAARAAAPLPVLRKDFIVDPYQVVESRGLGADCILLIMAALDLAQAKELEDAAHHWGMDVLVEVHDVAELEMATQLSTRLLGINNRDLKSLSVDIARSIELAAMLPQGYVVVGESGLKTRADLDRLADHGITCFLVGESLMAQDDVAAATRRLLEG